MSPPALTHFLNLFLALGTALLIELAANCHPSSPVYLLNQKLFLLQIKFSKKLCASLPKHDICRRFKSGEIRAQCSLLILSHFACRHC